MSRQPTQLDLKVLLALEATQLSEGQASKVIGVDRVTLRTMRDDTIAEGLALADRMLRLRRVSEEPGAETTHKRTGCRELDPDWPDDNGRPRGPRLCVTYPNCECGRGDVAQEAAR